MANGKIQYYTTAFSQRVWVTGTLAVQPLECEGAPLQESTWFQMEEHPNIHLLGSHSEASYGPESTSASSVMHTGVAQRKTWYE